MAMSGSFDGYIWYASSGKSMYHTFSWEATRNGYETTINYKVKVNGTDTQWVKQQVKLTIEANGSTKVSKDTNRISAEIGDILISGSFVIQHSYENGSASFSVHMEDVIYNYWWDVHTYDKTYSSSNGYIDTIVITDPTISSITDNGNNTITIDYDYGSNITGETGYLYLKKGDDATDSNNGYSKSITKSTDTSTKITVSLDSIKDIIKSEIKNSNKISGRFYQYNNTILKYSGVKSVIAYYYKAPEAPTGIWYNTDNKYGKYTPTSKITFKWTKPSSGCDGYRICIWKNGSQIKINENSYIYDRDGGDNVSYTIDCTSLGIKVGDRIKLGLYAYVLNGIGTKLRSGNGINEAFSNEIFIVPDKNFIAHAKISGKWKKVELIHAKIATSYYEVGNLYAANGRYS